LLTTIDECEEKSRSLLLGQLRLLLECSTTRQRLKIIITSRPHVLDGSHLEPVEVIKIPLHEGNLDHDIESIITHEVSKLQFPTSFAQEIRETLIKGAAGMFLWVSLTLDDINNCKNTKSSTIKKKLQQLPRTLEDVYKDILCKIEPEDQPYANTILQCVVWALRPLILQELQVAIAIRPEDVSLESLEEEMELNLSKTLLRNFGPMLKIENDTVHLVHQSAKDFLCSYLTEHVQFLPDWHLSFDLSNSLLDTSCLTYLSFDNFEIQLNSLGYRLESLVQSRHFLEYAAKHWADHVRKVDRETQEKRNLWRTFSTLAKSRRKLMLAFEICENRGEECDIPLLQFASLHGVTYFIEKLADGGALINEKGGFRGYALHAAALYGHKAAVQLLLDRGADFKAKIKWRETALIRRQHVDARLGFDCCWIEAPTSRPNGEQLRSYGRHATVTRPWSGCSSSSTSEAKSRPGTSTVGRRCTWQPRTGTRPWSGCSAIEGPPIIGILPPLPRPPPSSSALFICM
jgi:hypothetical protein